MKSTPLLVTPSAFGLTLCHVYWDSTTATARDTTCNHPRTIATAFPSLIPGQPSNNILMRAGYWPLEPLARLKTFHFDLAYRAYCFTVATGGFKLTVLLIQNSFCHCSKLKFQVQRGKLLSWGEWLNFADDILPFAGVSKGLGRQCFCTRTLLSMSVDKKLMVKNLVLPWKQSWCR